MKAHPLFPIGYRRRRDFPLPEIDDSAAAGRAEVHCPIAQSKIAWPVQTLRHRVERLRQELKQVAAPEELINDRRPDQPCPSRSERTLNREARYNPSASGIKGIWIMGVEPG